MSKANSNTQVEDIADNRREYKEIYIGATSNNDAIAQITKDENLRDYLIESVEELSDSES